MSKYSTIKQKRSGKIVPTLMRIIGAAVILGCIAISMVFALPRVLGYEMYNVVSGSMEPTTPVGSMIYVKSADGEDVKKGDIIAFVSGSSVITHRVRDNDLEKHELTTKGDANLLEDFSKVPYFNLIGVVKFHVPELGIWGGYFSTLSGKAYLLATIVFGFILNTVVDRLDPKKGAE